MMASSEPSPSDVSTNMHSDGGNAALSSSIAVLTARQDSGVLSAPLSAQGSNNNLLDGSSSAARASSRLSTAQAPANPSSQSTTFDPWTNLHEKSSLPRPGAPLPEPTITITDPASPAPVPSDSTREAWIRATLGARPDHLEPPTLGVVRDSGNYSHSQSMDDWNPDSRARTPLSDASRLASIQSTDTNPWRSQHDEDDLATPQAVTQLHQDFSNLTMDSPPVTRRPSAPSLRRQDRSASGDYGFDSGLRMDDNYSGGWSNPGSGIWSPQQSFDGLSPSPSPSPSPSRSPSKYPGQAGPPQQHVPHPLASQESVESTFGFASEPMHEYVHSERHLRGRSHPSAPRRYHYDQNQQGALGYEVDHRRARSAVRSYPSQYSSGQQYPPRAGPPRPASQPPTLAQIPAHEPPPAAGPMVLTDNYGRQYCLTPMGYSRPNSIGHSGEYVQVQGGYMRQSAYQHKAYPEGYEGGSREGRPARRKPRQWADIMAEEGIATEDRDLWYFMKQIRLHKYTRLFLGKSLPEMRALQDADLRALGLTEGARRKLITELFMIPEHAKTFPRSLNKHRYEKLNEAIRNGTAPYIPPERPGRVPPSHQRQKAILQAAHSMPQEHMGQDHTAQGHALPSQAPSAQPYQGALPSSQASHHQLPQGQHVRASTAPQGHMQHGQPSQGQFAQ
eukprot:TRINITY_DN4212_c0_g1_i1.p1 TRINITY_DN4212_c0_g1~~TRINITY_DN4212_c0_g1_i1.p1  ORF type:complete len:674 (+),score=126.44 TRINITY_DN4212_c0_g1_i1:370-2391(+)